MDSNNNDVIDLEDFSNLNTIYGKVCRSIDSTAKCGSVDINMDGHVDVIDVAYLQSRFGQEGCSYTPPADGSIVCGKLDWDENGIVNLLDFSAFTLFYGKKCNDTPDPNVGCGARDGNGDGKIDKADFEILQSKFGKVCEN